MVWTSTKDSILNFAEGEGVSLPSGCRVGECESCAVCIVSGRVRYLNGVESDDLGFSLRLKSALPKADVEARPSHRSIASITRKLHLI